MLLCVRHVVPRPRCGHTIISVEAYFRFSGTFPGGNDDNSISTGYPVDRGRRIFKHLYRFYILYINIVQVASYPVDNNEGLVVTERGDAAYSDLAGTAGLS